MSVSGTPPAPGLDAQQLDDVPVAETPLDAHHERVERRGPSTGAVWNFEGLDPRIRRALTVLGFAIPVIAYLVVIRHYQVNAIWQDQWDEVPIIHQSFVHFPNWSSLWAVHNENRMLFPNLIVVALAHFWHYNLNVENYISALMLFAATALFIWTHKRRSPQTPLLFYCPVVFLTLTFAQYQNTLWGFQMAWYLVLLALAACMFLLDRPSLTWPVFVAAALLAVVGSYSSLQGLLIWPVGLLLLYHRRRPLWTIISWIAIAGVTAALYFHNLAYNNSVNTETVFHDPYLAAKVYLYALGDVVGMQMPYGTPGNAGVMLLGIVTFVLAVVAVIRWGLRRDDHSAAPIGVALILFGLLFDATLTEGRVVFGLWASTASRYVTNDVLVLAGVYLTALGRTTSMVTSESPSEHAIKMSRPRRATASIWSWIDKVPRSVIVRVAVLAIAIQILFSINFGLEGARYLNRVFVADVTVSRNINQETNLTLHRGLYFVRSGTWIRQQAVFLREHRFAQFG